MGIPINLEWEKRQQTRKDSDDLRGEKSHIPLGERNINQREEKTT